MKTVFSKFVILFTLCSVTLGTSAASRQLPPSTGELQAYFTAETERIADRCLADIQTLADWTARREGYRRQVQEMLGLDPWPERSELEAVVTGRTEREDFIVENVQFQSRPGLYVTGNLYLPNPRPSGRAPTILYVCGHGPVVKDGVSYGNKVTYQHHGAWFARHGYVCLIIDTLQLGEIQGLHHGTHREGMWWWNSRGYTPAGVEAWNSIRALDYLATRPEVDPNRFGVTGRSGGGAYSWWLAALDDRVQAVAPVAGITDLHDHVVDGVVEGHCDCMYVVNTYQWDYPMVAALVAPRPLLIVNTDRDGIFPLGGVFRVHRHLSRLYDLHGASDRLGLVIAPGPHKDTQDLQVPVFRWFNQHLKGEDPVIAAPALKLLDPEPLKVFARLPSDQLNTTVQNSFIAKAPTPPDPVSASDWTAQRDQWMNQLTSQVFRGWPEDAGQPVLNPSAIATEQDLELRVFLLTTQPHVTLPLYVLRLTRAKPAGIRLQLLDDTEWSATMAALRHSFGSALPAGGDEGTAQAQETGGVSALEAFREQAGQGWVLAWVAPRGLGPNAWDVDAKKFIHIRRRFMLLGQTLDGMRVWDARRALQAARTLVDTENVEVRARGQLASHALYASLFEPAVAALHLEALPATHEDGPDYLNVLRFLDFPHAVAMAAERSPVQLRETTNPWRYPFAVARQLGWPDNQLTRQ